MMYKLIASVFGIGYIKGGGTVASFFCCVVLYLLNYQGLSFTIPSYLLVTVVLFFLGTLASCKVEPSWGKDNYRVVIDEVAGMWVSMLFLPLTLTHLIAGLVLFRFFDMVKPLFIRRAERLSGGFGVMADDVLAGIYSNIVLQLAVLYHLL